MKKPLLAATLGLLDGERAREIERYDTGVRIRTVVEGADGALWVLEDEHRGGTGRLLKLTPYG
jgi:glucose/arabinose dehydrogenase